MITPAFEEFPEEGQLIGLIVLGYSELDDNLCFAAALALDIDPAVVLDAIHQIENEGTRLDVVNRLARPAMVTKGHEARFGAAIGALRFCKRIRNQYAHAQWLSVKSQLLFVHSRDVPWADLGEPRYKAVDLGLLQKQEEFFVFTRQCLLWLYHKMLKPDEVHGWPDTVPHPPMFLEPKTEA